MSSPIKLGYSCWGFLGKGIVDTPDGGRSHRLVLITELIRQNALIIMLQRNRDLFEANESVTRSGLTFDDGYPDLDALFCEYRWPIPGRNVGLPIHSHEYTPDLERQNALVQRYLQTGIPIFLWDKDQKLSRDEHLRFPTERVRVFEPSFQPKCGRESLLFPLDQAKTQAALQQISAYRKATRTTKLIYIGNQYERDTSFEEFYDKPSQVLEPPAQIYGKWNRTVGEAGMVFHHVEFHGRVGFQELPTLYQNALSTILIAPDRYYETGHYTQRLFEAIWELCIPLVPARYAYAENVVPEELIVHDANGVLAKIAWLEELSDGEIALLLQKVLNKLEVFSAQKQAKTIMDAIRQ